MNPTTFVPPISVVEEGFTLVKNKCRGKGGGKPLARSDTLTREKSQGNTFEALASLEEGEEM